MEPLPLRGSETILLVEDEEGLRGLAAEVLTELGYRVLQASSGPTAISVALLHSGPVHLLVTDLLMPGMNGQELWLQFSELRPKARVLFISGYGELDMVRRGILKPGTPMLSKPFRNATLAQKVREVLDAEP